MVEKLIELYIAYLHHSLSPLEKDDLLKYIISLHVKNFDVSDKSKIEELLKSASEAFGEDSVNSFMTAKPEQIEEPAGLEFKTPADFKDLRREITNAPIHANGIKIAHSLSKYLEKWFLLDELPVIAYDEEKIVLEWTKIHQSVCVIIDNDSIGVIYDDGENVVDVLKGFDELDQESDFGDIRRMVTGVICGSEQ